jgi:outer membrane lipoprotein SlyB
MNLRLISVAAMAIGLSACTTSGSGYNSGSSTSNSGYSSSTCNDCGVVQHVNSYTGERHASGVGAVTGAVVGGLLGNQVGQGDGKTAATVAGAVVGGMAGNAIEKNQSETWYDISIRMNDGRQVTVTQNNLNGIREGSRIVVRNGVAQLN